MEGFALRRLMVRMGLMGLLLAGNQTVLAAGDGKLISTSLETNKLPSGVLEYAVWEPPGYQSGQSVPLIINLHGGGGSQDHLESLLPTISKAMAAGTFLRRSGRPRPRRGPFT
jgi:dipeptidyl aminopeptidase/acylaminoacyl peptidase